MSKFFGLVAIWSIIAKYPALSAGLANIIIVAGASVGLHLNVTELASLAGAVAAIFGVLTTAGVIPVTKVSNVSAGFHKGVPNGAKLVTKVDVPLMPVVVDTHASFTPEPTPVVEPEPEAAQSDNPSILTAGNRFRPTEGK